MDMKAFLGKNSTIDLVESVSNELGPRLLKLGYARGDYNEQR
jgi:hypothetical protein